MIDERIDEAVCIIADTDKWSVQVHSCDHVTPDRVRKHDVVASQFVRNMIDSVKHLNKLKMSPEFVSSAIIGLLFSVRVRVCVNVRTCVSASGACSACVCVSVHACVCECASTFAFSSIGRRQVFELLSIGACGHQDRSHQFYFRELVFKMCTLRESVLGFSV